MKTLAIVLLMCVAASAYAQTPCDDLLKKAKSAHEKGEYAEAFAKYRETLSCDSIKQDSAKICINKLLSNLNEILAGESSTSSNYLSLKPIAFQAELVLLNIEKQQKCTTIGEKPTRFYNQKFGLSCKDGKFGFISSDNETLLPYKYDVADDFDFLSSLADVKFIDSPIIKKYYIDTTGREYGIATSPNDFDEKTSVLNLLDSNAMQQIWQNTHQIKYIKWGFAAEIPADIKQFQNLEYISFMLSNIKSVHKNIAKLPNLKAVGFNLSSMSPRDLRTVFQNKAIRRAQFSYYSESKFDYSALHNTNLEEIFFMAVSGRKNSPKFFNMPSLKTLKMKKCSADTLEIDSSLANLESLELLFSDFKYLSWGFSNCHHLRVINGSYNQFDSIPAALIMLSGLEEVLFTNNKLSNLPDMGRWQQVKILNLSNNKFLNFPAELLKLQNLEELDLSGNPLKNLPQELKNLKKLKKLIIKNNKFSPETIAKLRSWLPSCDIII